jgi:hypothetical protein
MSSTKQVERELTTFRQLRQIVRDLPPHEARRLLREVLATLPEGPEDDTDLGDQPDDRPEVSQPQRKALF